MASVNLRGSGFGRVARTLVFFQFLGTLALPLALCCCLKMAAETTAHGSPTQAGHEDHGNGRDTPPCPHHTHTPADAPDGTTADCGQLVQLVLMLSGLIGIPEIQLPVVAVLSPAGTPLEVDRALVAFFPVVESPPPRT